MPRPMAPGDGALADKPMRILEHLEELRVRLIRVVLFTAPIFLFVLAVEVHFTWWYGIPIPVGLGFTPFSALASQVFRFMINQLVPSYVEPTQLSPAQALTVQFEVAAFLTILLGMPILAYEGWMFIAPALYHKEKRFIAKVVIPATVLFIAGAIFAYLLILPFTFGWLYGLGAGLGARRFILSLDDFLSIVLIVMAAMGFAFQTPLIMWGLTSLGIIQPAAWKRWWRYAVIVFFIFGAVVTPDGSGVTQTLVALPMTALYFAGMGLSGSFRRPPGAPRVLRPKRVIAASLAAVVVLGGVGYAYLDSRLPGAERVVTRDLVMGTAPLELPVMTFYAAPGAPGLNATTTVVLSANSSVLYHWQEATVGGYRVVFVPDFASQPYLALGATGGSFRLFPGQIRGAAAEVTFGGRNGRSGLFSVAWVLEYTGTFMERVGVAGAQDHWVELRYRLRAPELRFRDFPAANVSVPAAADLVPAGTWSVGFLGGADFRVGLEDVGGSGRTFGSAIRGPSLSLGAHGVLPTTLRNEFRWGSRDRYTVAIGGPGDLRATVTLSWDARFGSLYPTLG